LKSLKMRCPVCEGGDFFPGLAVFDDRYGEPNEYCLGECMGCGHTATWPRLEEVQLPNLYGAYYPRKSLSVEALAQQANGVDRPLSFLRRWWLGTDNQGQYVVRSGERVLDVGCGTGVSLLEAQALGAEVWGIEADPNVQRIARALHLRIHAGSLYDQPFPGLVFDLIILNQVIEHIPDPDQTLKLLRARLAPGGRIVLVFPNVKSIWSYLSGARWINWHVPYHLHHFHERTFSRMASRCGYRVARSRTITPNLWLILQLRASRYIPTRGVPSPIWGVTPSRDVGADAEKPRQALRAVLVAVVLGLIGFLARVVDALKLGDSLLVELRPEDSD
jgi:2-polyprenyl-3-methyl-5-hydroxy-6-metoxy-1,4-benzoquinol methylase